MAKVIELVQSNKPRKGQINKMIIPLFALLIVLLILNSNLFSIKNITVEGNYHYTKEDICNILNLDTDKNIFHFFMENYFKDNLDPYINKIKINIAIPNTVKVNIVERKIVGYVPYMGTYLCIDKDGQVIDNVKTIKDSYPILEGLMFDKFTLGKELEVKNKNTYYSLLQITNAAHKYKMLQNIINIDVTNIESIIIYTRCIEIKFGTIDQYDKKMNIVKAIYDKLPENERGILDVRNIDKPIVFKKIR